MRRKTPCQYCKQRRRKCERESEFDPCQRCIHMKRKCIPLEQEFEELGSNLEGDDELITVYGQVQELENQLEILQVELDKQKQMPRQEPQWIIKHVNGELQLTSKIKSLEEFMLYEYSILRYLSPFGNVFSSTRLEFKQEYPSFIQVATTLLLKYQRETTSVNGHKLLTNEISTNDAKLKRLQLVMEVLIDSYFRCYNDFCPILHEKSYREHYSSLKDPLTDATTLAICASSALSGCKHSIFNSNEKRVLGELFFQKCMSILVEIFDDDDRALESLLVINVLQYYLMSSGRFKESRKWATVAFLLASGLKSENDGYNKGGDHLPPKTRIKYAILHRHSIYAEFLLASLDFLLDNKQDAVYGHVRVDTLPDESQTSKDFIEMTNYMLELASYPSFIAVMVQTRRLSGGDLAELRLEDIVRYEEAVKDWWHRLPENLKICSDPYKLTNEIINGTNDIRKLLIVAFVNVTAMGIQGVLLQPKADDDTLNLHTMLKDKAAHLAVQLMENCLALTKKMDQMDNFCYSPGRLLIHTLDSLMALVETNSAAMKPKLKEYLEEFRNSFVKSQEPVNNSPFFIISDEISQDAIDQCYLLPTDYFLLDMVQTVVEQRFSNINLNS